MTKEVSIVMEGIQKGSEDSPVLTTASGIYHMHHDKHYIQFEEQEEEGQGIIKNMIKIALNKVEMTKKGTVNSEMVFDLDHKTEIIYRTSFGTLYFEAQTSKITINEEAEKLEVLLEYSLFSNDDSISENRTIIRITSSPSQDIEEA